MLVDYSGKPKIADFGLSRILSYSQTIFASTPRESAKGSLRWMAYELLQMDSDTFEAKALIGERTCDVIQSEMGQQVVHTKESDMWAFGMVIYVCFANT